MSEYRNNTISEFTIKHFDTALITFSYIHEGLRGEKIEIIYQNENAKELFPVGLTVDNEGVLSWLKRRIIPKNRMYVDALLSKIGLNHNDTIGIIRICKGLSLNDCYWVVESNFDGKFADYNLYDNRFEKTLSLIAYTGYGSVKARGFTSSPEFTTNGMLKKAWRYKENTITLYKGGTSGAKNTGNEPYSEFYSAQVAKAMELDHIEYGLSMWKKNLCSTCALFTSKDVSYVQIYDFVRIKSIYEVGEFLKTLGEDFYEDFSDMLIFDAIICNEDRHYGNFGLLVDAKTNLPIKFAPIFDNGISLFNYAMADDIKHLDEYAKTRLSSYNISFIEIAREYMDKKKKEKLRKLLDFKFEKHKRYNLPSKRLLAVEKFIRERSRMFLNM